MHNINIVIDDNSGGVLSVSEKLFDALNEQGFSTSFINLKDTDNGLLLRFFFGIFSLLRNEKKDVYLLMHFTPVFLGVILRFIGYKKLINVIHIDLVGYFETVGFCKRLVIRLIFFLIKKEPMVFVSKEAMLRAKNFFNLKDVSYIYNLQGLTIESHAYAESIQLTLSDNKKTRLGMVSRLHSVKNIDLAIRVVKELKESGYDIELIIYGDGLEKDRLSKYVAQLDCSEFVILAGRCDDKRKIFDSFDALISFASLEGLPTVILESLSFNTPVFYTDCHSGPRELMSPNADPLKKTDSFEDTGSGFLVKPILKNELRPYALDLSESEKLYVDYLIRFVDKINVNGFSDGTLNKEFDSKYILGQWFYLINKVAND